MMDTCALAFLKEMEVIASKRSDMNSGAKGASDILSPKKWQKPVQVLVYCAASWDYWWLYLPFLRLHTRMSHYNGSCDVCINICFCLQALVKPCWGLKPVFMLALQEGLQQFVLVVNP
jgi:hypothetical protein